MVDFTDERFWIGLGVACYALAFAFGLAWLGRNRRYPQSVMLSINGVGFLFHSIGIYGRGLENGSCPLGNPFEIVHFIIWTLVLIYFLIGPAFRMSLLGFFTSGLAGILGLISLLAPGWDATRRTDLFGGDPWIETHAALAMCSYGVFAILAITSLMYLLQNYALKHKKFDRLFAFLPSLFELEQMNRRLHVTGVVMFTIAVAAGSVFWFSGAGAITPTKLTFTVSVWLAYVTTLVLRRAHLLMPARTAWACLLLFILALFALWPVEHSRTLEPSQRMEAPLP